MNIDDILHDKTVTNGPFDNFADLAQGFKFAMRRGHNWDALPTASKEALEQAASAIAGILAGNAGDAEHWNSLAVLMRIRGKALESVDKSIESNISRLARMRAKDTVTPLSNEET
jgi:hypothetical protein